MIPYPHWLARVTAAALLGASLAAGADADLPATKHQAEAVPEAERDVAQRPPTAARMPITEHQEEAVREFAADAEQVSGSERARPASDEPPAAQGQ